MGETMVKTALAAAAVVAATVSIAASAAAGPFGFVGTNVVASSPVQGGGYPVPPGSTKPQPGTCRSGSYDANRSESWIAVKPGTEDLVGASKFFFEKFSTYYDFHLGSYRIVDSTPVDNNQVQGYDCVSTGTQDMPPSWTNNTDPNVAFDTKGRVYQVTLPFNAYWEGGLHPNAEIDVSYSDDMGRHWTKGNGGKPLEPTNNQSSLAFGHVEDKQWVAVNHIVGNANQDHVYAAWAVFNGAAIKVRFAVSRDRGQTFDKATMASPSQVSSAVTYVYPAVDAAGDVYAALVSFPPSGKSSHIYVARSTDDGRSFGPWVSVATPGVIASGGLPNTRFRDGIVESFAASPTYPGHLYVAYEDWDGTQMDVELVQSTDGGMHWSDPALVNDNEDTGTPTDQFQPSVAAGPDGAVAVAFYDRRRACPQDDSVLPADRGRENFCIDTTLQAYKDTGSGAVAVGGNVRMSEFAWDPEQPGQKVDGLSQYPCAAHRDPCPNGAGFIGDYFGLAISDDNVYGLFVSTHYPSSTTADGGGPVYYQQQVLATVPRSAIGSGY